MHDIGTRDVIALSAIIDQLDIIITSDNIVAHLAGALNKPVYLILPFSAKWYWLCHDDIALWYPGVRIHQQPVPNQWKDVIGSVLKSVTLQHTGKPHNG